MRVRAADTAFPITVEAPAESTWGTPRWVRGSRVIFATDWPAGSHRPGSLTVLLDGSGSPGSYSSLSLPICGCLSRV